MSRICNDKCGRCGDVCSVVASLEVVVTALLVEAMIIGVRKATLNINIHHFIKRHKTYKRGS